MSIIAICLVSLYMIGVNCGCKYIRRDNIAYELNTCSFSSTLSSPIEVSWGFYCQKQDDESWIAEFRQWNNIDCNKTKPDADVTLFQIDCNGEEDNCDCIGSDDDVSCSSAILRIENCTNDSLYQETNLLYELCETGTDSSQQLVCDNGDNLKQMQYENGECDGYGFEINSAHFDFKDVSPSINATILEPSEICSEIICKSDCLRLSSLIALMVTITIGLSMSF